MEKSSFNSVQILENERLQLDNVVQLALHNYSNCDIKLTMRGVTRTIPALTAPAVLPYSFVNEGDNTVKDFDLTIEFVGKPTSAAILDWNSMPIPCKE